MSHPHFFLTDATTVAIVTGAYAIVIDKKTGRIIRIVPEMPIQEKQATALASAADLLVNTQGLHGVEELRAQVVKLALSLTESMTKETMTAKAA